MTKLTKKDELKKAIMDYLNNEVGSVSRKDINNKVGKIASDRTISRALAELKLTGLVLQQKDGRTSAWVSTEPKTKPAPIKKDAKPKIKPAHEKAEEIATAADKKEKAGKKPAKKSKSVDISKFDINWVNLLIDQKLTELKLKPTTLNKNKMVKLIATQEYMDDLKTNFPATWKARNAKKKEITKKDLVKAGKVTRNASDSGKPKKSTEPKKPGVIATIIKSITKKYRTKKQILAELVKAFPEREADKMIKTINVQVPSRLRKDKGLEIEKTDKGYKIISK